MTIVPRTSFRPPPPKPCSKVNNEPVESNLTSSTNKINASFQVKDKAEDPVQGGDVDLPSPGEGVCRAPAGDPLFREAQRLPDSQSEGRGDDGASGKRGSDENVSKAESEIEVMSRQGRTRRTAAYRASHSRKR